MDKRDSSNRAPACLAHVLRRISQAEKGNPINSRLMNSLVISGVDVEEVAAVLSSTMDVSNTNNQSVIADIAESRKRLATPKPSKKWNEIQLDANGELVDGSSLNKKNIDNRKLYPMKIVQCNDMLDDELSQASSNSFKSNLKPILDNLDTIMVQSKYGGSQVLDMDQGCKYFGVHARNDFYKRYKLLTSQNQNIGGCVPMNGEEVVERSVVEPQGRLSTASMRSVVSSEGRPSLQLLQCMMPSDSKLDNNSNGEHLTGLRRLTTVSGLGADLQSWTHECFDLFNSIDKEIMNSGATTTKTPIVKLEALVTPSPGYKSINTFNHQKKSNSKSKSSINANSRIRNDYKLGSCLETNDSESKRSVNCGPRLSMNSSNQIEKCTGRIDGLVSSRQSRVRGSVTAHRSHMLPSLSILDSHHSHVLLSSLNSPRSSFIATCIREGLNPLPSMIIRKHMSTEMNLAHYGMCDGLGKALAECLCGIPQLDCLNLSDNHLTDESLVPLLEAISQVQSLFELNLSGNKIDSGAAAGLSGYLAREDCPLVQLILQSADIDDGECVRFVQSLDTNKNLRSLDMSNNKLGSSENLNTVMEDVMTGGEVIADFISSPSCCLTTLKLSWNSIRLGSAVTFAKAMASNCTLTYLDLSFNGLGNAAGESLGDSLLENCALKTLLISNNAIASTACLTICVAIIENFAMTKVVLDENPIGECGSKAVMQVPLAVGSRVTVSCANCNTKAKDPNYTFNHDKPLNSYLLNLSLPYDRAVAFMLLQIFACHGTYIFADAAYIQQHGNKKETQRLQLIQTISTDKEKYFDAHQRQVLEGLNVLRDAAANVEMAQQLFAEADLDGSGELDKEELMIVLNNLGMNMTDDRMQDIMSVFDVDGAGTIEMAEFLALIKSQHREAVSRIKEMTEYPIVALKATPNKKYVPPKTGMLKLTLVDGCVQKALHQTFTACDQLYAQEMAKSMGDVGMMTEAIKLTKIRYSEALLLYGTIYKHTGNKAQSAAKLLPLFQFSSEAREFVSKITGDDRVQIAQVKQATGQAMRPIMGIANGFYSLNLALELDRICLSKLLEMSQTVNSARAMKSFVGGYGFVGDTSQLRNWTSFRNCLMNNEPFEITMNSCTPMPSSGRLEFDFSGSIRPVGGELPLADKRLVNVLCNICILPSGQRHQSLKKLEKWKSQADDVLHNVGTTMHECNPTRAEQIGIAKNCFYDNLSLRANEFRQSTGREAVHVNFMKKPKKLVEILPPIPSTPAKPSTASATVRPVTGAGTATVTTSSSIVSKSDSRLNTTVTASSSIADANVEQTEYLEEVSLEGSLEDANFDEMDCDDGEDEDDEEESEDEECDNSAVESQLDSNDIIEDSACSNSLANDDQQQCRAPSITSETWSNNDCDLATLSTCSNTMTGDVPKPATPGITAKKKKIKDLKRRLTLMLGHKGVSPYAKASRMVEVIEETFCNLWILSRHLAIILQCFKGYYGDYAKCRGFGSYLVEVTVALFGRVVDIHNFEIVLEQLSPDDCGCTYARLGILNLFNPMKPEGALEMSLGTKEDRLVAKMIIYLSVVEPGNNLLFKSFQWKRDTDKVPGWEVTAAWSTDEGVPDHGFFVAAYYSGGGEKLQGCLPSIVTRRALLQLVLIDENELYGEDELPPDDLVNSGIKHYEAHKRAWNDYLAVGCSINDE